MCVLNINFNYRCTQREIFGLGPGLIYNRAIVAIGYCAQIGRIGGPIVTVRMELNRKNQNFDFLKFLKILVLRDLTYCIMPVMEQWNTDTNKWGYARPKKF
jgi:hypothetical protein